MTGESILVVEDEGLIALHITELLEKAGYQVIGPMSSGEMALKAVGEQQMPDLVLMDIKLGGTLNGIETARMIRQRVPIPLIFLTAYSLERMHEQVKELRPEGYLTKPVMEKDLLALIGTALAGRYHAAD
jgi:two-component system, response regulator PdtaR